MTPEAGHKENEDEFVSRVWRFKQNIFQYLWTIYYAWAKPKYFDGQKSDGTISPDKVHFVHYHGDQAKATNAFEHVDRVTLFGTPFSRQGEGAW